MENWRLNMINITKTQYLFNCLGIFMMPILICCLNGNPVFAADISGQHVRSPINHGGPEDWPEHEGLSTSTNGQQSGGMNSRNSGVTNDGSIQPSMTGMPTVAPPSQTTFPVSPDIVQDIGDRQEPAYLPEQPQNPVQTASGIEPAPQQVQTAAPRGNEITGQSAQGNIGVPIGQEEQQTQAGQPREVIYVDEAGNPVPKPPEPDKMYEQATAFMDQGKYDEALAVLEEIRNLPNIPRELLEKVLYGISDCIWARYADNPLAGFEPVISSTNEALNSNLRSARVPDALLRLGLANLKVGNIKDAAGYIVALMRRFPDYPGVAQGFTSLGQAQLKDRKYAEAEQSFGIVLDKYPESSQLEEASVGLSRALVQQGKDERAQVILDFISKRWPRYYINDPDFLLMQAANDEKLNREDAALALDWLYVNLDPERKTNAPLLLKMGDTYMKRGNAQAANFVYGEILNRFPDSPAAVTARMRLAEKGIYDSPINYTEMARVFSKGDNPTLWRVYNELAASAPGPEQVLSQLKQAMWLLWDKQYTDAMGKASEFIDNYPEHADIGQAKEVLWQGFKHELDQSLREHNYGRILLLWNGFPYIRERYGNMDAPLRFALAQGWKERGDEQKAFELFGEFLKGPMDPDFGEAVFTEFFNTYLKNGEWNKILDLGNLVRNWKMKPELQNQLDYAEALSAQNLNLGAAALNRWKNLATRTDIPLYQQAYATYFLAKDAERRHDIRGAYEGNRKVVEMFTKLVNERSDKADPERIKEAMVALMDICEVGNRVPEALQWLARYNPFITENSPDYPGLRFREARLYRKLGDEARSQALLENIVTKFPESPFAQAAAAELRTFDVSRDLQRFIEPARAQAPEKASGSTSGNWSSSTPAAN